MDGILNKITAFTDNAHGGQMRKYTPERYIVHPVRVMQTCKEYTESIPVLAAALLHDVLEDTPVNAAQMRDFLMQVMNSDDADKTLALVIEMTDVYVKDDYPSLNRKARKELEIKRIETTSPDAQTIKYADIIDNCSEITKHDPGFAPRFLKECMAILKVADKGNPELRQRALMLLKEKIKR